MGQREKMESRGKKRSNSVKFLDGEKVLTKNRDRLLVKETNRKGKEI